MLPPRHQHFSVFYLLSGIVLLLPNCTTLVIPPLVDLPSGVKWSLQGVWCSVGGFVLAVVCELEVRLRDEGGGVGRHDWGMTPVISPSENSLNKTFRPNE